ncbi:taste receptor type 2 member 14-like [Rhynchocyon petersi]
MVCVLDITFAIIISAIFVIGNLGNGWIAFVNCTDWAKTRKISLADQLLTALAISRIGHLWVIFIYMVSALQSFFIVILSIESITGILGNGFIALVNCIDWVKIRKISLVDQILTVLVMSRIFLLLSIIVNIFVRQFDQSASTNRKNILPIAICGAIANHFSVWLATTLSLFYYLKIANFSNPLFLYLKQRIRKVVLVMLFLGHLKNMKCNATRSRDSSTKAHITAMKTVISFLLLFAVYFLCLLPMVSISDSTCDNELILKSYFRDEGLKSMFYLIMQLSVVDEWKMNDYWEKN